MAKYEVLVVVRARKGGRICPMTSKHIVKTGSRVGYARTVIHRAEIGWVCKICVAEVSIGGMLPWPKDWSLEETIVSDRDGVCSRDRFHPISVGQDVGKVHAPGWRGKVWVCDACIEMCPDLQIRPPADMVYKQSLGGVFEELSELDKLFMDDPE